MKADANAFDDTKLTSDGIYVYSNDTIQTTNPIGSLDAFSTMKAIWCMKYELSQAGYVDFLNTLTQIQQANHTTATITSAIGTRVMPPTANNFRNYIEIKVPASGGNPAVYGCDANNNNIFDEPGDGEWVACNFLNWIDAAAYMDWSGRGESNSRRSYNMNASAGVQTLPGLCLLCTGNLHGAQIIFIIHPMFYQMPALQMN